MPVGAKLMERWFAGELNYSPTSDDEKAGVNQLGNPYSPDMINKTDIKMKWVLGFQRANAQYEHLIKQAIYNSNAIDALRRKLQKFPAFACIDAGRMFGEDVESMHQRLQFQHIGVEASFSQKLRQEFQRIEKYRGVPDDLTASLGSFNFYVAIDEAYRYDKWAEITAISVYVRDNYTFGTDPGDIPQYLGHWSTKGVIVVPYTQAWTTANKWWLDYAVKVGDPKIKGNVYYPVRNSDFRAWQHRHHRGGDFIIYSDVYKLSLLLRPITVRL